MPRALKQNLCAGLLIGASLGVLPAHANQAADRENVCDGLTQYATAVALAHQSGTPYAKILPIAEDLRTRFGTDHPIIMLKAAYAFPRYTELEEQKAIILAFRDQSHEACLQGLR